MYFPDLNPVIKGLNTYYIKTDKLIEHFQGEIGTGVIYFKGPVTEGTVFFESEHYIKSFFKKNGKIIFGDEAFSLIMENCEKSNYEIYIYYLEPDEVYLWSEILMSAPANLSVELKTKSIKQMIEDFQVNKETGYFITGDLKKTYGIFFAYGEVSGYLKNGDIFLKTSNDYNQFLNEFLKFLDSTQCKTDIYKKSFKPLANKPKAEKKAGFDTKFPGDDIIHSMGEFISVFEIFVSKNKKIKSEFLPLLKKKFIDHIDEYDFLDPFAAEFVYSSGKISFSGVTDEKSFVESLFRCIKELASETGTLNALDELYKDWSDKNQQIINKYNLKFH